MNDTIVVCYRNASILDLVGAGRDPVLSRALCFGMRGYKVFAVTCGGIDFGGEGDGFPRVEPSASRRSL